MRPRTIITVFASLCSIVACSSRDATSSPAGGSTGDMPSTETEHGTMETTEGTSGSSGGSGGTRGPETSGDSGSPEDDDGSSSGGENPRDPERRCPAHRTYLEDVDACVIEFDLGRVDPGLPTVFETIWTFLDENYGAFPAKDVDWPEVREDTLVELREAASRSRQHWAITKAVAAIGDGHTAALSSDLCSAGPDLGTGRSNTGACVTEADERLFVYATTRESVLESGDELLAIDGRPPDALLRDQIHQPRCVASVSTEAQGYWTAVDSLMWRPEGDETFTVLRDGEIVELAIDRVSPTSCDRRLPPPIDVDHGSGVTSTDLDGIRYIRVASFFVTDASGVPSPEPLVAALREAFTEAPSEGVILDLRVNPGGFSAVYLALAGWLFEDETELFRCRVKNGPRSKDYGDLVTFSATSDPSLQYTGPLALLIDARSFSSADFTFSWLSETGRARTFGHPSAGGFGNGLTNAEVAAPEFRLAYNDLLCENLAGELLEGFPPPVDEPMELTEADIAAQVDPVIEAAEAWLDTL